LEVSIFAYASCRHNKNSHVQMKHDEDDKIRTNSKADDVSASSDNDAGEEGKLNVAAHLEVSLF
jgi:hypothetical protein